MPSSRRAFVFSCAVGVPLLVVTRIPLSSVAFDACGRGTCSFCSCDGLLAGIASREPRICDECVLLSLDIWDLLVGSRRKSDVVRSIEETCEAIRRSAEKVLGERTPEERARLRREAAREIQRLRASPPPPPEPRIVICSFCDGSSEDGRRMIAGAGPIACERCVVSAARALWSSIEV